MVFADWLTKPLFGKTEAGIVFYRFGNRSRPQAVNHGQIERIRSASLVTAIIVGLLFMSGLSYFAALSFIIAFATTPASADFGFDPRWMYLAEVLQLGLIGIALLVYNGVVSKILRTP